MCIYIPIQGSVLLWSWLFANAVISSTVDEKVDTKIEPIFLMAQWASSESKIINPLQLKCCYRLS